ncbi:MAG: hypothetical protein ACYDAD_11875 [Acidimicrobiales bacterium]
MTKLLFGSRLRNRAGLALLAGLAACLLAAGAPPAVSSTAGFGSPVPISGDTGSEPGLNVAPDDSIYVNTPSGLLSNLPGSPSPVFKSTDGGATFTATPPGRRALFPGGGDANIAVDPSTGTLYMTDLYLATATVSRSTDGGRSWVANPIQGTPIQDRQWVATAGHGNVYHLTHQVPAGLVVARSVAPLDGIAYPVQTVAATLLDQTGCECPPGNLIARGGAGPSGDKVGFAYPTSTGGINFARSQNSGLSFASSVVSQANGVDTTANFPVVADAGSGHLVATWLEIVDGRDRVQLSSSPDWGSTWTPPSTLVSAGTSVFPWIDARGAKVSVSLYHTDAPGTPDSAGAGARWFESYMESANGGATFSGLGVLDPVPAKTGIVCTQGINCSKADRSLGDFQTVALDNRARANVVYDRVSGSNRQVYFARQ